MDQIQDVRKAVEAAGAIWVGAQTSAGGGRDAIIFLSPNSRTEISLPIFLSEPVDFSYVTRRVRMLLKSADENPRYVRVKHAHLVALSLSVLQIQNDIDKLLGR